MGTLELFKETDKLTIYSPKIQGNKDTEFQIFLESYANTDNAYYKKDFDAIITTIAKMLYDCGARENLFRPEIGNVKAIPLYIRQYKKKELGTVRLYCIRISDKIIILGNGTIKKVQTNQEDKELIRITKYLKDIEHLIYTESKKKHIQYNDFEKIKSLIEQLKI